MATKKTAKKVVKKTAKKPLKKAAKKINPNKRNALPGEIPGELIDARIKELGGWRGETLKRLRTIITAADPRIVEEWKWSVPVWSAGGIICTGETYKAVVKLILAKGASLKDSTKLFNSSLEGNTRRAIDVREGEKINGKALTALVKEAVKVNTSRS